MSDELEIDIRLINKQQSGQLSDGVKAEFIALCRQDFNYNPDMSCGQCIFKHAVKLFNKYLK